jgi:hypothetical protein
MSPTGNPTPGSRRTALPTARPLLDLAAMGMGPPRRE